MDTLSESELDHLWELMKGHAPGPRAEFAANLRSMVALKAVTVKVSRDHVEVTMPLAVFAFDRRRGHL